MAATQESPVVLLRVEEAARRWGVGVSTAWKIIREHPAQIRRIKVGKCTRLRSDDVNGFVDHLTSIAVTKSTDMVGAGV